MTERHISQLESSGVGLERDGGIRLAPFGSRWPREYPFDDSALEKHKQDVIWPGLKKGFVKAGFEHSGPHWLSNPDAERSIYRAVL